MLLTALIILTPIGMIAWGGTTFVVRLRRQRRRDTALPSERFDLDTLIDEQNQPDQADESPTAAPRAVGGRHRATAPHTPGT